MASSASFQKNSDRQLMNRSKAFHFLLHSEVSKHSFFRLPDLVWLTGVDLEDQREWLERPCVLPGHTFQTSGPVPKHYLRRRLEDLPYDSNYLQQACG